VAKRRPRDIDDPNIGDGEDEYFDQDHLEETDLLVRPSLPYEKGFSDLEHRASTEAS
jgi:hypothetical protein